MTFARAGAGDEGIQPLDLVCKAVFHQEIQGPVGNGWLTAQPLVAQPVQDVIGAERPMALQQQFKHAAPHRGELQPLLAAALIHRRDPLADAGPVIVPLESRRFHGALLSVISTLDML